MLGLFVEKVVVAPFPAGTSTHLSRRRVEDDEALATRRAEHLAAVLKAWVALGWK